MTTYYHLLLPCRAFFFFFFFFCSIVRCAARRQLAAGGRLSRRSVRTTDHDKRQAAALKLRTLCCGSPARTLFRTTACPESPSGQVVRARGPDLRPGRAPSGPDLRSGGPSARNAVSDLTVRFFPDLAVRIFEVLTRRRRGRRGRRGCRCRPPAASSFLEFVVLTRRRKDHNQDMRITGSDITIANNKNRVCST